MGELHRAVPNRDEACVLRFSEVGDVHTERPCRPGQHGEVGQVTCGRDEDHRGRAVPKRPDAVQVDLRDGRNEREGCVEWAVAAQEVDLPCRLDQGEWIPASVAVQAAEQVPGIGPATAVTSSVARSKSSPASSICSGAVAASSEASPARVATSTATGSATSRRNANASASALDPSIQWASSTATITGPFSA